MLSIVDKAVNITGAGVAYAPVVVTYSIKDPQVSINGTFRILEGGQQVNTTGSDGNFALTLYAYTEMRGAASTTTCTITLPDGSKVSGVVPAVSGPLVIADLLNTYSWTQTTV